MVSTARLERDQVRELRDHRTIEQRATPLIPAVVVDEKKSLSWRWMMLKRRFDVHWRVSLLYWTSALKNTLVVKL